MTSDIQTPEAPTSEPESRRGISVAEVIVGIVCAIGVVVAVGWALSYSGLTLYDREAMDVVSNAWTRTATIGVIVALTITACVGVFVFILARSTIGHDDDEVGDD